jgi:hypothetical protein
VTQHSLLQLRSFTASFLGKPALLHALTAAAVMQPGQSVMLQRCEACYSSLDMHSSSISFAAGHVHLSDLCEINIDVSIISAMYTCPVGNGCLWNCSKQPQAAVSGCYSNCHDCSWFPSFTNSTAQLVLDTSRRHVGHT